MVSGYAVFKTAMKNPLLPSSYGRKGEEVTLFPLLSNLRFFLHLFCEKKNYTSTISDTHKTGPDIFCI